jgi:hypothetical protein
MQSHHIDVWTSGSSFDEVYLRRSCRAAGIEIYDEMHGPDRSSFIEVTEPGVSARIVQHPCMSMVQPGGAVYLPREFPVLVVGEFGPLLVLSPEPSLLCALKLVRGNSQDIDDAIWWATERGLKLGDIQAAIVTLPAPAKREAAVKHLARLL